MEMIYFLFFRQLYFLISLPPEGITFCFRGKTKNRGWGVESGGAVMTWKGNCWQPLAATGISQFGEDPGLDSWSGWGVRLSACVTWQVT